MSNTKHSNFINVLIPFSLSFLLLACGGSGSSISAPEAENTSASPVADSTPTPSPAPPTTVTPSETLDILAIGDSYFNWNLDTQHSIPDEIGKVLQQTVTNRAEGGAMIFGGDGITDIRDQYTAENWDWVVMDGGGNDLNDKCGCNDCAATIEALISMDGNSGEIPALVNRILLDGSKVVVMQYPQLLPDAQFGFASCQDEFTEMTFRINQFALNTQNLWLVEARDVVPTGDESFFDTDKVHPSIKGSQVIGQYIAQTIINN